MVEGRRAENLLVGNQNEIARIFLHITLGRERDMPQIPRPADAAEGGGERGSATLGKRDNRLGEVAS